MRAPVVANQVDAGVGSLTRSRNPCTDVQRRGTVRRQVLRREVERHLRDEDRLDAAEIEQCFAYVLEDPGPMDLGGMLRKNSASDRSI